MKKDVPNDIYYKLGEMHGDIKSVLEEAKRTNGRVTRLESETVPEVKNEVDDIKRQIAYWMGGASVVIFILNLILPKILEKIS